MQNTRKKFKQPPKRFQPKGLEVVFEDSDIIVVNKESGILSVCMEKNRDQTAFYRLTDYVRKGNSKSRNRLYDVASLNRLMSGVLLFAKNQQSRDFLKDNWDNFEKSYIAIVDGVLEEKKGSITSTLLENKQHHVYSKQITDNENVCTTHYQVEQETNKVSLVKITLNKIRKHQLRVHLNDLGHPIIGDKIYGESEIKSRRLLLHAESIKIVHPITKETLILSAPIPELFNRTMKKNN